MLKKEQIIGKKVRMGEGRVNRNPQYYENLKSG
jgi:hypothetical protein